MVLILKKEKVTYVNAITTTSSVLVSVLLLLHSVNSCVLCAARLACVCFTFGLVG